jgi:hypothetical protein
MGRKYIFVAAIVVSFVFLIGGAQASNVNNPDFESGNIGGWSTWCVTGDVVSGINHTPGGNYSASPSLNDPNGPYNIGGLIQDISVSGGEEIKCSAWIKTDSLASSVGEEVQAILKFEFWGNGLLIGAEEAGRFTGTTDWTQALLSCTVPSEADTAKVILLLWSPEGTGNSGNVYFDDVELTINGQ